MDVRTAADRFYGEAAYMRGFTPDTIRRYRCALEAFLRFAAARELEKLTTEMVRTWFYQGRMERQWKSSTFHTYYKSLKAFFRWCIKNGYLEASPVADLELPKREKGLPAKLRRDEAMRLLEAVYNRPYRDDFLRLRNHAIFATFIFAGLRKQELLHLETADVNFEDGTLLVRRGKGAKDRVVPMARRLKEILQRYGVARARSGKTCPEFFISSAYDMGFSDSGLRLLVSEVRKSSGIAFTMHKLRHTFATLMLEGGCDIYSLSRMMGHEEITTTTIYLAASPQHLRSQIAKHPLNEML